MENRIAIKIKTGYYLQLLIGSTESKVTKTTNGENRHTLKSGPGPGPGPSEKGEASTLEKVDPIQKSTICVKSSISTNLRVLISNMTIVF